MTIPLVSALMPTTGSRTDLARMAARCFYEQSYENLELVVVEDLALHSEGFRREVEEFLGPRLRWITCRQPLPRGDPSDPLGPKFNVLCSAASGDLLTFWADDDWHHPDRVRLQVEALGSGSWCALKQIRYVDLRNGTTYLHQQHCLDGTFLFRRSMWQDSPFPLDRATGWWHGWPELPVEVVDDPSLYVATLHDQNLCPKKPLEPACFEVPEPLQKLVICSGR